MSGASFDFRSSQFDPQMSNWLRKHNLPTADLPNDSTRFYEGRTGERRVCIGALQRFQTPALLRSVVVRSGEKGKGYGRALIEFLLEEARSNGLKSVYLLTTTADSFFEEIGFTVVDRSDLSSSLRSSEEARKLCPDSAVCMKYSLDPPPKDQRDKCELKNGR